MSSDCGGGWPSSAGLALRTLTDPNQEIISEAKTNYDTFTVKLTNEFATARGMIASYVGRMASRNLLVEVRTLLDQIKPAYPVISARQHEVLDLQGSGEHEKANELLNLLNDIQRTVQTRAGVAPEENGRIKRRFRPGRRAPVSDTCAG